MKPVDSFLRSVRLAFRPEEESGGWGWLWALLVIALLVSLLVLGRLRGRRKARRSEDAAFARWLRERGLSAGDEDLLRRLAERAGVSPLLVGTHIEVFQRATAAELATVAAPDVHVPPEGVFAQVARLRRALGFHVLPEQVPLLSTREFASGARVSVDGVEGMVGEVNEAWFDVEVVADGVFAVRATDEVVRLAFVRGGEARYTARCRVAALTPARAPRRLILRHDEMPERVQKRNAVRVAVRGAVELRPRVAEASSAEAVDGHEAVFHGELVDLSIGGLAMLSETKLAVGVRVRASFDWEGGAYRELPALVLGCTPHLRGRHLMRLEFRALPASEENRLAAAIARRTAQASASHDDAGVGGLD